MSQIKAFLFSVLVLVSFSACSGEKTVHWKQEVLLQDGRVIEVNRISKLTGKLFPENSVLELEQRIEFANPDSGERISWLIPKGLSPNLIGIDSGIPYLVLRPIDYNAWDCPNPPFVTYVWRGHWERIPFEQLPEIFQVPNLFLGATTDSKAVGDGIVTVEEMQSSIKESSNKFKIISREKVSAIAQGCNPDTLIKLGRQSEINYRR